MKQNDSVFLNWEIDWENVVYIERMIFYFKEKQNPEICSKWN